MILMCDPPKSIRDHLGTLNIVDLAKGRHATRRASTNWQLRLIAVSVCDRAIPSGGLTVRRCRDTSFHSFALYRCGQTSIFPQAETCHAWRGDGISSRLLAA